MEKIIEKLAETPIGAVCATLLVLSLAIYKILPMISKRAKTYTDDERFMRRFEDHARRVHSFSGEVARLHFLERRVRDLEEKMGGTVVGIATIQSRVEKIDATCMSTKETTENLRVSLETMRQENKDDVNGVYDRIEERFQTLFRLITDKR